MDIDKSKDYLSSGQSKRLLAFSIIAALTSLPMAGVDPAQLGIVGVPLSLGETLMDVAQSAIKYTFSLIAAAIFGTLGFLFTAGTYEFLFFKAPGQIPELRKVWWRFAQIFWWVLPVAGSAFFLGQMLFPEKEEADIYRFMERTLVAGIALLVTGPMFNSEIVIPARPNTLQDGGIVTVDLFSAAVIGVNEIGKEIFPSSYSLVFLQDSLNSLSGRAHSPRWTGRDNHRSCTSRMEIRNRCHPHSRSVLARPGHADAASLRRVGDDAAIPLTMGRGHRPNEVREADHIACL